jgi:AcrR family transcriptional regulator
MAGRPREFDRDEALRRVQALFWERGYEGVTLSDLVQATGLASARLYAAFGSKEQMFRESVQLYERAEGGFADRALADEPAVTAALERLLLDAIDVYTRPTPRGCLVVTAATNCTSSHRDLQEWLAQHRRRRTMSIVNRLQRAAKDGDLPAKTDIESLGQAFATFLNGLSTQARDGVSSEQLRRTVPAAMTMLQPRHTNARMDTTGGPG